jgi:DNA-binding transcriptional LysR family regulator
MQADLNRLHVFHHVFQRLSVTAAADALFLTPSAVSQQVKRLEAELGAPLFVRLHKRLVPTPEGQRLFTLIQPLLADLYQGLDRFAEERSEPSGLIRFGAPVEFGSTYLPHVIATFRAGHAKVTFDLELGRPLALLAMVEKGELDFAFVDTFPTKEQRAGLAGCSAKAILEEEVVLACSRQYLERHGLDDNSFTDLSIQPFISQQRDAHALNNWFLHHFGKVRPALDIVFTVSSHQAVVNAIKHHLGLGIVVSHLVWEEISAGKVMVLRPQAIQAKNRISMVQLAGKVPPLRERLFLNHLQQLAQSSKTLRRLNLIVDTS